ncbi:tripartite motif-containing protein 75-like [Pyxicephalus adspersus]|uniref:tripartite motif-containing protein 75-like n=1 Tax=Pyxicephalus adspersus TaxID=30357 RepID=UPI003B5ADBC0
MPCLVAGDHKGHQVDLLNQASEKMKEKLKETTNVLDSERQDIKRRIQNLEMHSMQETGKNVAMARKVTDLFREIRKQLDEVEKRILLETCRQKKQLSQSIPNLIQQLEQYNFQLSKKIDELEELCNTQDPLTILKKASQREDSSTEIGDSINDVRKAGGLSEGIISRMLQKGLSNFTDNLKGLLAKRQFSVLEKSDVLLDINTAHDNLVLTRKRKRVTHTDNSVNRPDGPKRFKCCQILSIPSFTSGTHYWEVDVSEAEAWMIGVAGESMERGFSGNESFIGFNDKSWSLIQKNGLYVRHKNVGTTITSASLLKTVGICLDYESGLLSFYQLCNPIRHLHTFTTTFTEPLHAAFYVFPNSSLRLIK